MSDSNVENSIPSDMPSQGQTADQKAGELLGLHDDDVEETEEIVEASADSSEEESEDSEAAIEASSEDGDDNAELEDLSKEDQEKVEDAMKELKKKLKLKVHGQEIEEEVDWNDEEKLVRELQKAKAFDKTSQEHAVLKKQVQDFFNKLQDDPASVVQELGIDFDEIAKSHLERRISELEKSPEQVEQERIQRELEQARKELDAQKRRAEEAQMEQLRDHYAREIENDIVGALENGETKLPKTQGAMRRIADAMHLAMSRGMTDIKAADVIPVVEQQFLGELRDMLGVMPADVIEGILGKPVLDKLRQKRVSTRKKAVKTAKQIAPETAKVAPVEDDSKPKKSYKDVFNNF